MGLRPRDIITWPDKVLLAVLLLATAGSFGLLSRYAPEGRYAVILVDGKVREKLDLSVDRVLTVSSAYGTNVVEVKDGRIRVREASCPNQLDVARGWIHRTWEEIVCLPNRFVIRIVGDEEPEYDGVTR